MESQEVARKALLTAVMQGRTRPVRPLVNPVVDRKRSPVSSGLVVADLELCSEPNSPQGWVPIRLIWDPRALGAKIPPTMNMPHPHPQQRHPQEIAPESKVQRQLQLKLQLYDTDSGPSLEPPLPGEQPRILGNGACSDKSSSEAAFKLQRQRSTLAAVAAAAPRPTISTPKHEEQLQQAKGLDNAHDALQSLCYSPYDEPPEQKKKPNVPPLALSPPPGNASDAQVDVTSQLSCPIPILSARSPSPRTLSPRSSAPLTLHPLSPHAPHNSSPHPILKGNAKIPQNLPACPPNTARSAQSSPAPPLAVVSPSPRPVKPPTASAPLPTPPSLRTLDAPKGPSPVSPFPKSTHSAPPAPSPAPPLSNSVLNPQLPPAFTQLPPHSRPLSPINPLTSHQSSAQHPVGPANSMQQSHPAPRDSAASTIPLPSAPSFMLPDSPDQCNMPLMPSGSLLSASSQQGSWLADLPEVPHSQGKPYVTYDDLPSPTRTSSRPASASPLPPLRSKSKRRSSFSFPFPNEPLVVPTPYPSPPMSPGLVSAGPQVWANEEGKEATGTAALGPFHSDQPNEDRPDTAITEGRSATGYGEGKDPAGGVDGNSIHVNGAPAASSSPDTGAGERAMGPNKLPVAIFLHATGSNMDSQRNRQEQYAFAGYFTLAIDCRYHGERRGSPLEPTRALHPPIRPTQTPVNAYQEALVRAWRGSGEHPFLLDNVFDIMCCLDYLATRPEVDMTRIGITGVSLGGMHAWLTACADQRITVTAPMIGVQGFGWAIHHNVFKARVASIPLVFEAAAKDMSKPSVDAEVVEAVWKRLLPGMLGGYDAHLSLPALFPRPFLIVNGALDPRCPIQGVTEAYQAAQYMYMRRFCAAQQIEKEERRSLERMQKAEEEQEQRRLREEEVKLKKEQPPDPRDAPAKPQHLTISKIPPGIMSLITAETLASLGPSLSVCDCEAEAFEAQQEETTMLAEEAIAEHAQMVDAINALALLYVEPGVAHVETAGMHKAVKEFFDIYLKGPSRRQTFSSSTLEHLVLLAE